MMNRTLIVDMDGTIAEWGDYPELGKPTKGVQEAFQELKDLGFTLLIASARTSGEINKHPIDKMEEKIRMEKYLDKYEIPYDEVLISDKFPAMFYIDDRAIEFKNNWAEITKRIRDGEKDNGIYSYEN